MGDGVIVFVGVTIEVPAQALERIVVDVLTVFSGGATLLMPYEVLHLSTVVVENLVVTESASASATNADVVIKLVSNMFNTENLQKLLF